MTVTINEKPAAPGTRPEGVHNDREAALRVREMFGRIAPRYDFLNHFLSLSLDRVWRARTARHFRGILVRPEALALDLCCGTGDLAFALDRPRAGISGTASGSGHLPIIGVDFAQPMLERAKKKSRKRPCCVSFAGADALRLPFADETFDLVATAFGFRNLANYEQGLLEIARVLRKGGAAGILEFSEPGAGLMARVFRFYFRRILPRLGGAISGSSEAYAYLPNSVAKFPAPDALAALMERCGFEGCRRVGWNFGSVVLHSARRK